MSKLPPSAFARLERLVHRASDRLRELHQENAALRERLGALEGATGAGTGEGWQTERAELVERVEKLVVGLDDLLAVVEDE